MTDTAQFRLPLLGAAQAQKHVIVNEALTRIDALARLRFASTALASPPASPAEGDCYLVPSGATGAWAQKEGKVAIYVNGGWDHVTPLPGWTAFDMATGSSYLFDGTEWIVEAAAASIGGAATQLGVGEWDQVIGAGAASLTPPIIPAFALVLGVTGRVLAAITGSATGWSLGVSGSPDRYGSGYGVAKDSFALGLTGSPLAYYADTPLLLSAEGGSFTGGTVRLAVHFLQLRPPRPA